MSITQKRLLFYCVLYVLIFCLMSLSLMVNVKSAALNDRYQKQRLSLRSVKEENKALRLILSSANALQHIQLKARNLGMVSTKQIHYLKK